MNSAWSSRWRSLAGGVVLLSLGVAWGALGQRALREERSPFSGKEDFSKEDGPARLALPRSANVADRRPTQLVKGLEALRDAISDAASETVRLRPGRSKRMTMNFREAPVHRFVVEVPDDAVVLRVEISGAPCIFDIYGRTLLPLNDLTAEAEHYNAAVENKLRVSRYDDYPLETGEYHLAIEYPSLYPPAIGNRTLTEASYDIAVSFVTTRVDGELKPGLPLAGTLSPETGSFRTFVVEAPETAQALRIDLDNTHSDLDVLARHESQILHPEEADHTAAGRVGREILVIDEHSDPPLAPGRWYVNVIESMATDKAEFTIHVSLDDRPPATLLPIPAPPPTPDGKQRALYAAVDLTTGTYSGSGVLVSPAGLILTNYHVIAEAQVAAEARRKAPSRRAGRNGAPKAPALDDVIVAMTVNPRHPPVEMFRGEVIEFDQDNDLALVQITRGYYGQPIPNAYRFPFVALGRPETLEIGDPLFVVGFPAVGDLRNRPAVTLTQGIVSGFSDETSIKTDAQISAGNSGGGVFNREWRLVGCPTSTVTGAGGDFGQLGYIVSLEALPAAWRERINALSE